MNTSPLHRGQLFNFHIVIFPHPLHQGLDSLYMWRPDLYVTFVSCVRRQENGYENKHRGEGENKRGLSEVTEEIAVLSVGH